MFVHNLQLDQVQGLRFEIPNDDAFMIIRREDQLQKYKEKYGHLACNLDDVRNIVRVPMFNQSRQEYIARKSALLDMDYVNNGYSRD